MVEVFAACFRAMELITILNRCPPDRIEGHSSLHGNMDIVGTALAGHRDSNGNLSYGSDPLRHGDVHLVQTDQIGNQPCEGCVRGLSADGHRYCRGNSAERGNGLGGASFDGRNHRSEPYTGDYHDVSR